MPPAALARALDDGLGPSDWYALLNGFVFLWPDRERMDRQRRACGKRPQVVLTFDGAALLDRFAAEAFVSPITAGNARRKAARRRRDTLVPYTKWLREGWPTGRRTRPPAELLLRCTSENTLFDRYLQGVARAIPRTERRKQDVRASTQLRMLQQGSSSSGPRCDDLQF